MGEGLQRGNRVDSNLISCTPLKPYENTGFCDNGAYLASKSLFSLLADFFRILGYFKH